MPWSVLPMRYATIVPQHAIDRLLTTDLDVNFLWMQTNASLDFSFMMQMLSTRMQMRNVHMMQMSHAGVQIQSLSMMVPAHIFKPWCKCLLVGMPWCKCPLVGMPWCKCPWYVCHDANVLMQTQFLQKFPLTFFNRGLLSVWNKNIFKSWFVISRKVFFLT